MASESSFDVVSRVDGQELDNALNQTRKEIENRFDFKHSKTSIEFDGKKITLVSDDELKMRNVVDMLQSKAVRRGIDIKAFEFGSVEPAANQAIMRAVPKRTWRQRYGRAQLPCCTASKETLRPSGPCCSPWPGGG